jgi:6-phosphofructokinase 1
LAAALSRYHQSGDLEWRPERCQLHNGLCFPEAGPRKEHVFPRPDQTLNVGILVSGGIAPGINSVIDGITHRHYLYANENNYVVTVQGLLNGFYAFDRRDTSIALVPDAEAVRALAPRPWIVTADLANAGGSMIGTSRVDDLIDPGKRIKKLEYIVSQAYGWPLDILYVIGGDGSMKAAHAIWSHARDYAAREGIDKPLSVVGIPKTMDNDILWVWQSFGFLSAVEKAREVIQSLYTETSSNPRLCVVQLFGSDSGFVVSHAVLASRTGVCDAALIPEVPFEMHRLARAIKVRMTKRRSTRNGRIPAALVVMAETAIPEDAMDFIDDDDVALIPKEKEALREFCALRDRNCRIQGQTNEWLRSAGLKIVSRGLEKLIKTVGIPPDHKQDSPNWELLRVFTNEPRHLLRAIDPSCMDIIIGQRLGALAVDNTLAGYTDFMISQWLTEYVLVPLELVVLGRKRIPRKGVFWRSVESKTGQGDLMLPPDNRVEGES